MAMGELSQPFTDQKNPAVASKCQRMVLKRANDQWESTHIPSSCSIVNDPEEDAVKVCKEVKGHQKRIKVGCVFPMAVVCRLPYAGFGRDDHREDAPHFIVTKKLLYLKQENKFDGKLLLFINFIFKNLNNSL